MPKKIFKVFPDVVASMAEWLVADGEHVEKGDLIGRVESMKMMYDVHAPAAGVLRYKVDLGEIVGQEDAIALIEASDE